MHGMGMDQSEKALAINSWCSSVPDNLLRVICERETSYILFLIFTGEEMDSECSRSYSLVKTGPKPSLDSTILLFYVILP